MVQFGGSVLFSTVMISHGAQGIDFLSLTPSFHQGEAELVAMGSASAKSSPQTLSMV
jgi:hypothetical protein